MNVTKAANVELRPLLSCEPEQLGEARVVRCVSAIRCESSIVSRRGKAIAQSDTG